MSDSRSAGLNLRAKDPKYLDGFDDGKIEVVDDADRPFKFDLGSGCGVCYHKNGRVMKKADELDIIWIKKIAKDT